MNGASTVFQSNFLKKFLVGFSNSEMFFEWFFKDSFLAGRW